jgi:hypothetical protein
MLTAQLPITVKEARKLLGRKASSLLTDSQIEELINQLDFMATLAIRDYEKTLMHKENKSGQSID